MKYRHLIILPIAALLLCSIQCKKNKSPLEQLPSETQSGAGTFGCLVNGKALLPKGDPLAGPVLACAYQFLNGGFYFQLRGIDKRNKSMHYGVGIYTDSLAVTTGGRYSLTLSTQKPGAYGLYFISEYQGLTNFETNTIDTGELVIKKFDEATRIVSGTFWFDARNSEGAKVEVRNGRFDIKFTL